MSVEQRDLWGQPCPPRGLKVEQQVAYVMDRFPHTKDDDNALYAAYLWLFGYISEEQAGWLVRVMDAAPDYGTLARRRRAIQRNRTADGVLQPSYNVLKKRRARDGAGPPRW